MINQTLSDELLLFFERYLTFYKDFLRLEAEKYDDIIKNQYEQINKHVKEEEVFLLRSKGLEIERDKLLAKTEAPKASFRELIPSFDPSSRKRIEEIYEELSQVLLDLKEMNRRCNSLTEIRLHRIHTVMEKLEKHPELRKVYNSQAYSSGGLTGILSKKI